MTLTVELIAALVAIAGACVGIWMNLRSVRRSTVSDQGDQITKNVSMQFTLSSIADDVKQIKADMKNIDNVVTQHEFRLRTIERDVERKEAAAK